MHFLVEDDKTGHPLSGVAYKLTLANGNEVFGNTDANGLTEKVGASTPDTAKLEVPYYGNGTSSSNTQHGHDACRS